MKQEEIINNYELFCEVESKAEKAKTKLEAVRDILNKGIL